MQGRLSAVDYARIPLCNRRRYLAPFSSPLPFVRSSHLTILGLSQESYLVFAVLRRLAYNFHRENEGKGTERNGQYEAWNLSTHNAEIRVIDPCVLREKRSRSILVSGVYSFLMGELMGLDYVSLGSGNFFANPCGTLNRLQLNGRIVS